MSIKNHGGVFGRNPTFNDLEAKTLTVDGVNITTAVTDLGSLSVADGNIIVGDGTNWVAESGVTARASLGLAIDTDVQSYDADTAKYDDATANFTGALQQAGSQAYVRNNILASVSQSGGVPTGGIIEYGTNANGDFIKLADGTAIAWGTVGGLVAIGAGAIGSLGTPTSPVIFTGIVHRQYLASVFQLQSQGGGINASYNTLNGSTRNGSTGRPDACIVKNEGSGTSTGYSLFFVYTGRWY